MKLQRGKRGKHETGRLLALGRLASGTSGPVRCEPVKKLQTEVHSEKKNRIVDFPSTEDPGGGTVFKGFSRSGISRNIT